MTIDFNRDGENDAKQILSRLKRPPKRPTTRPNTDELWRGFDSFVVPEERAQMTSPLWESFKSWSNPKIEIPEPVAALANRDDGSEFLKRMSKTFNKNIVEPLKTDLTELNRYSENAQKQGVTNNVPMGFKSVEEKNKFNESFPLYRVPVVGPVLKFFNNESDELTTARGKLAVGETLTKKEKNLLNEEQFQFVAGAVDPLKPLSKGANVAQKVAGETLEQSLDVTKNKMRYLVNGVDNLVKRGWSKEAAEKVKLAEYEQIMNSGGVVKGADDFIRSINLTPKQRVNVLDYLRTPDRVLEKIGLKAESDLLRRQYDSYLNELPEEIGKITSWSKRVAPESNERIFRYLDGEKLPLDDTEKAVAKEVQEWFGEWANRLGLPKDKRIKNYITHIFDDASEEFGELDPEIAKMIRDEVAGSVYDPFLQKRTGGGNYVRDTWRAMDAYAKRAVRKANLDPALKRLKDASENLEASQFNYVKSYVDRINLRPTEIDNLVDNLIKSSPVGYKFGPRPTNVLTKKARQATYRGMLGLNFSSALRNLSQGANTYATLGEKYTAIGYAKVVQNLPKILAGADNELDEVGVLGQDVLQDRTLNATKKFWENTDKGLFYLFEKAEAINRGAAYWGAKAKYLANGKTEEEAIELAKELVRKTQFTFGAIDTPVALQSDIAKTLFQLQSYTTKQAEFLTEMAADKNVAGLVRWIGSTLFFTYTIGKAFGMSPLEAIPTFKFGVPPTAQVAQGVYDAATKDTDSYGNELSLKDRILNNNLVRGALNYIPAGSQLRKTYQGTKAVLDGGVYSKSGRLRFPVEPGLQPILFGPNVSQTAKDYYSDGNVLGENQTELYKAMIESGISPTEAYERVPRTTSKEDKKGWFSFLTKQKEKDPQSVSDDALISAYQEKVQEDENNARIRELFKTGLSPSEINNILIQEGLGTYEEASMLIIKDLEIGNGERGEYLRTVFEKLDNDNYLSTIHYLIQQGVMTNALVDWFEDEGDISTTQAKFIKDLIKRSKDDKAKIASYGSGSKPKLPSLDTTVSIPSVPKLNIPRLEPLEPLRPAKVPSMQLNRQTRQIEPYQIQELK